MSESLTPKSKFEINSFPVPAAPRAAPPIFLGVSENLSCDQTSGKGPWNNKRILTMDCSFLIREIHIPSNNQAHYFINIETDRKCVNQATSLTMQHDRLHQWNIPPFHCLHTVQLRTKDACNNLLHRLTTESDYSSWKRNTAFLLYNQLTNRAEWNCLCYF